MPGPGATTVVKCVVEIHRSRGAPLNDYIPDEQIKAFFVSSYASVALRGILHKNNDEASKKNDFQKKVYQKIFICRGDRSFSRAKKCYIFPNIQVISNGKPMEIDLPSFSTSIDFLLKITGFLRKYCTFLLSKMIYLLEK